MFRQVGIYSPVGQLYQPQDSEQLMFYKEDRTGQILEEGITEAGSISSFIAAGTSYSAHDMPMIPFYIYYSMFGYQRVGDLVWAAGDSRTRGFMLGGTAGRTTLNGEGLQHEDGHSHVLFSVVPNCRAYDPTYGFEVAVIIQEGLRRMVGEQEDIFYYLTLMNENYQHPAMPAGAEDGILRGMYLLREGSKRSKKPRVQLLGSGTMLREVLAAADLLADDWGVVSDVWSVTSFTELRRDGIEVDRWNLLHPTEEQRTSFVEQSLGNRRGPVVASTDYVRTFADQIRTWVPREYRVLGTDGFGRSDYRSALRRFFEVDRHYVTVSALKALADSGEIEPATVQAAIDRYGIDAEAPIPTSDMTATGTIEVVVPDIGDFDAVPIIEILVSPGDTVAVDDPLVTLESDKATMDVPAPAAGVVKELKVKLGDNVSQGSPLLTLEGESGASGAGRARARRERVAPSGGASRRRRPEGTADSAGAAVPPLAPPDDAPASADSAPPPPAPTAATPAAPGGEAEVATAANGPVYASPSVRRVARELGVDLTTVAGTGRKGRITKTDVESALERGGEDAVPGGAAGAAAAGGAGGGGCGGARADALAEDRLREVRAGGTGPALADQQDRRRQPGPQLGDDPPCHPQRRGRHHGPRGVPQAAQRGARPRRREADHGRLPRRRVGRRAEAVPQLQLLAGRRRAGAQALLQHRVRGRHARRSRRPGHQGRRPQGDPRHRA